jgi:hypothetical protein
MLLPWLRPATATQQGVQDESLVDKAKHALEEAKHKVSEAAQKAKETLVGGAESGREVTEEAAAKAKGTAEDVGAQAQVRLSLLPIQPF